jgi:hypothetical protein
MKTNRPQEKGGWRPQRRDLGEQRNSRVAILLSGLGIVLTAASVAASVAQCTAADLQAKAALAALAPQVEARLSVDATQPSWMLKIDFYSEGGPAYGFWANDIAWIDLYRAGTRIGARQLVNSSFGRSEIPGRLKGELTTLHGYVVNTGDLQMVMRSSLPSNVGVGHERHLVMVRYTDAARSQHEEFFDLRGPIIRRVDTHEGRKLWDELTALSKRQKPLDLRTQLNGPGIDKWWKQFQKEFETSQVVID